MSSQFHACIAQWRRIGVAALLSLAFLAPAAVAQNQTAGNDSANARKARQTLDTMIAAMGGNAFMTAKDMTLEGRSSGFYHGNPTGSDFPFWDFIQYPDKERVELTKQRDVIQYFVGDKGTETTYKGVHPLDPEDLKPYLHRREYRLDYILRVWLKDPATALFYDGTDIVEANPVDKVTLINSQNQAVTLMIDSNSHWLLRKQYETRDPASREKDVDAEVYGNYHVIQGIATPYTTTRSHNGDITNERFLNRVVYNTGFPDSFFVPAPLSKHK